MAAKTRRSPVEWLSATEDFIGGTWGAANLMEQSPLGGHHVLKEIQELLVSSLNLPDMAAGDIDPDQILFGDEGLGLDSIDALELGVALQEKFSLSLKGRSEELRGHFRTPRTLADFVKKELASQA